MHSFTRNLFIAAAVWFSGAVVLKAAEPMAVSTATETVRLTLVDAMALAIQNNLTTALASAQNGEARGRALQTASSLLPQILGTVSQSRVFKENLASQGFGSGGFGNPLIGPFDSFDARLKLIQNIFNLDSVWRTLASRADVKAAALQESLAREQVASAAALAYVEVLRTGRAVEAAQSDLDLSQSLLAQARDQHKAGTSTGVDVARAETRVAQDNVRLIRARMEAHNAGLRLKRVAGLPLSRTVALTDPLQAATLSPLPEEKAVGLAGEQRIELQLTRERVRADELTLRAVKAQRVPVVTGSADYGYSGNHLDSSTERTGSVGIGVALPLYFGGQIKGQITEVEGRKKESEALYRDTLQQVEEDVRLALNALAAEAGEVKSTALAVSLAERELKMARDRYAAGVGDNIQVTSAQTSLAEARDQDVDALARYNAARINVAMSLGQVQQFQFFPQQRERD